MKRYLLFLAILIASCKTQTGHKTVQPIILSISFNFNYPLPNTMIVGSNVEKVDSVYYYFFNMRVGKSPNIIDTLRVYYNLRRYYVSERLETLINNYIAGRYNKEMNCQLFAGDFYEFSANNNSQGKRVKICLQSKADALKFYEGLEKKIKESNFTINQYKPFLEAFRQLTDSRSFPPDAKTQVILLKEMLTPEQKDTFNDIMKN